MRLREWCEERLPAARVHEAADLGDAARHDEGEGVVAVPHAGQVAADDGDDVLHRAAHLDAHEIASHVDAEVVGQQDRLEELGHARVLRGDDGGGEAASADLLGVVGPGEDGDAVGVADAVLDELAHEVAGALLDALGEGEHRDIRRDMGRGPLEDRAQEGGRDAEDDAVGALEGLGEGIGGPDVFGQDVVGQVDGVAVAGVDALDGLAAERPDANLVRVRRRLPGDGGAPGA